MQFAHSMERAVTCAVTAFERMKALKVAPTPNNYEMWYAYVADSLPELRQEIDQMLSRGTAFTPDVCESLYQRHIGSRDTRDGIDDASRRLQDTMTSVATAVGTAQAGAQAYGQSLESFSGAMQHGGDGDRLAAMLAETRRMTELNRKLEQKLTASRKEVEDLRRNLDTLEEEASTDALTGISNRKIFDRVLTEESAKAQANGTFLSLLMVDIDHFKAFNDTHGHPLGDQVLKLVARSMVQCVRETDTAARYGGEEFSVILPNCTIAEASTIAEKIRRTVAGRRVINRRTNQDLGRVTLSVGVAEMALGEPLTGFVQRADEALYAAKRTGRNRVVSQRDLERADAG
ncbi:GGDEF domain protein [Caenispirillum salinarum AK4]|uniref:diguanylate cyclase n=1 Tax=Caenispirillum salinarum AK4 TaxID=1238182 RepID=K9HHX6_9PROT|nr:GGDEF domain-containing protein [Caenispirillum salinarum]EKV28211.1 GGDEF domain protein [Caenispirillum salinarum AK4]